MSEGVLWLVGCVSVHAFLSVCVCVCVCACVTSLTYTFQIYFGTINMVSVQLCVMICSIDWHSPFDSIFSGLSLYDVVEIGLSTYFFNYYFLNSSRAVWNCWRKTKSVSFHKCCASAFHSFSVVKKIELHLQPLLLFKVSEVRKPPPPPPSLLHLVLLFTTKNALVTLVTEML